MSKNKTITVKLTKSTAACTREVRATVAGLGLKRPGSERTLDNTPAV